MVNAKKKKALNKNSENSTFEDVFEKKLIKSI